MDPVLSELISTMLRWLHVIAAMAWIGTSFYFVHLDLSLRPRDGLPSGVRGDAWQAHGGGFYHMMKYVTVPPQLPPEVTWFKWEAYATWLSGMALLIVTYYLHADLFLVDPAVLDISPFTAGVISFVGLALAWLAYEGLCRSRLGASDVALAAAGYAFLVALTVAFTQTLSGRGAFTQIGAIIGTMMVANVFVVIIPNQKKTVAALQAGQTPDPVLGRRAGQRSLHNNYLTLPVIFLMVSSHYPLLFATRFNWLIVAIVLPMGAVIRHFFNSRHAGTGSPWWTWAAAAAGAAAIAALSFAGARTEIETGGAAPPASFEVAQEIVQSRCSMCHTRAPFWAGIAAPPQGILLDSAEHIRRHAPLIELTAVRSRAMPPGNVTRMTRAERQVLAAWLASEARAR
jgi:uncharacterized membrane protein